MVSGSDLPAGFPDPWTGPPPGLCGSCLHRRVVVSGRGSTFLLCRRSADDPRFRKYPPLPVLDCSGWEPAPPNPQR